MYQLMLADIRVLISIKKYRIRKRYILLTVLFFFILIFSALRLTKNDLNFTYVSSLIYSKKKCGIKIVYTYNNEDYVMTRGRQNVTSERTPSTILTS